MEGNKLTHQRIGIDNRQNCYFEMILSASFIFAAAIIISLFFDYSYSSNDDVMLKNIVSGVYAGTPDAHMIYIMYPLGLCFKLLYTVAPMVEWYDIFSLVLHYLCWFLIIAAVGTCASSKKGKVLSEIMTFSFLLFLDLPHLVMAHYTVLASLVAGTAILYYILGRDGGRRIPSFRIIVIISMILCLLLRKQLFLLSLPIGGTVLLFRIITAEDGTERKKELRASGIMIGIILIASVLLTGWDAFAYWSPEWKEFQAYNKARTDAYDYYLIGNYSDFSEDYRELAIYENDFPVIVDYNTQLIPGMNSRTMEKITELGRIQRRQERSFRGQVKDALVMTLKALIRLPLQPSGFLLTIALIQAVLSVILVKKRIKSLPGILLFLYLFGVLAVFLYKKRFPEHVAYGFYFMLISALYGFYISQRNAVDIIKSEKARTGIAYSLLLTGIVLAGIGIGSMSGNYKSLQERIDDWKAVNDYCADHGDNCYLMATKSFVFSAEKIGIRNRLEADNTLRLGTWVEQSPLQKGRLDRLGINSPFEAYLYSENCFLIQKKELSTSWIEAFYGGRGYPVSVYVEDELTAPSGGEYNIIGIRNADSN